MLTDIAIRNAKPRAKPFKIFDTEGLFILVNPTGSRLWRCRYHYDGKEQQASFGAYPAISLKQARERRDKINLDIAEGRDPRAKAINFEAVARRYISEMAAKRCDAHETYSIRRMKEMFAAIGSKPLDEVKPKEIGDVLEDISGRGAPSMADKARALVNQTFRYAINKGLCAHNPAATLSVTLPDAKPRPAVALTELPNLISSIEGYGGDAVTKLGSQADAACVPANERDDRRGMVRAGHGVSVVDRS